MTLLTCLIWPYVWPISLFFSGDSTAPSAFEETRDALGKAWKVLEARETSSNGRFAFYSARMACANGGVRGILLW